MSNLIAYKFIISVFTIKYISVPIIVAINKIDRKEANVVSIVALLHL